MENLTTDLLLQIRFTQDFMAVQVEGDIEDPSSFGLTLMTALRSIGSGAEALSMGALQTMRGFDGAEGFQLQLDDSGHNLKKFSGIVQWEDFDKTTPPARQYPIIPSANDLNGWIDSLRGVRWRGFRSHENDEWSHYYGDAFLGEDNVSAFGLAVLQLDLLVRTLGLPRRQLQLTFENSTLWTAVNQDSDFLLVVTDQSLSSGAKATLQRCLSFFTWPLSVH